ncbi:hypothetical protein KUCAC02_034899, partial [Chaenocephalus aceratus]
PVSRIRFILQLPSERRSRQRPAGVRPNTTCFPPASVQTQPASRRRLSTHNLLPAGVRHTQPASCRRLSTHNLLPAGVCPHTTCFPPASVHTQPASCRRPSHTTCFRRRPSTHNLLPAGVRPTPISRGERRRRGTASYRVESQKEKHTFEFHGTYL